MNHLPITHRRRAWWALLLGLFAILAAAVEPAGASSVIDVRLSIKYILGSDGVRPTGFYSDPQNILAVVDSLNGRGRARSNGLRPWRT